MRIAATALVAVVILVSASPSSACWGFRPMGMGGAFVAVADDANCAYWNRAAAAQLEIFSHRECQIIYTGTFLDSQGFLSREARQVHPYYDSVNFAQRLGANSGWTFTASWSGGWGVMVGPSYARRLPDFGLRWLRNHSVGIGYFFARTEWYTSSLDGQRWVPCDTDDHEIDLDWFWRISQSVSAGIHIECLWVYEIESSPDQPGVKHVSSGFGPTVRPGIAWSVTPKWVISAGTYAGSREIGTEYKPSRQWALRCGLYNFGGGSARVGNYNFGFGYKPTDRLEIGYVGTINEHDMVLQHAGHSLGISWKWNAAKSLQQTRTDSRAKHEET